MTAIFASRIDSHLGATNLKPAGTMSSAPHGGVPLVIDNVTTDP